MLVIQRTRSCSSVVVRGRRDLAFASATELGIPRRAKKDSRAWLRADCGSFSVARRAFTTASSNIEFSYLSHASSMNLRASPDCVEIGMAPKRRCPLDTIGGVCLAARLAVSATREAGVFGRAPAGQRGSEIRKKERAAYRFM